MIERDSAKLSVAMQLFAKLRRTGGRTIDVVWALKDPSYAREVLRLAHEAHDFELEHLAERFQSMMFSAPAPSPSRSAEGPPPAAELGDERTVDEHYIGHLR